MQAQKEIFEKYLVYRIQNIISLKKNEDEKSGIELLIIEIIRLGQECGEIRDDLPGELLIDLFEFVFIEVAKDFYHNPVTFKADETINKYVEFYMNAVKVNH